MDITQEAREIHGKAIVIDGHCDILLPVVDGVTSLVEPWPESERERWRTIAQNQRVEHSANYGYTLDAMAQLTAPAGHYELPLLEEGGVTAQCVAIFIPDDRIDDSLTIALEMTAALHRAVEEDRDRCLLATSTDDIRRAKAEGKVAYILTMEGAEPFQHSLELIEIFARLGLKMTTLTHSRRNLLADGTQLGRTTGGLTNAGIEAVERLSKAGIVVDLAHISDASFWDVIERVDGPLLLSHTSLLQVNPDYRAAFDHVFPTYGMTKAQAIAEKGGLIGVVFWSQPDSATIVDELDAIIAQTGPDHAGLGTDFYGFDQAPGDLQHIGQLPVLTEQMLRRGYGEETILKVLGGNYLRIFDAVW
ncbi:dipeptidase [soil metagenome]